MATLRNKTTEDGSIVRWAPHPDHNRPSTYQVTQRALSFLREIAVEQGSASAEVVLQEYLSPERRRQLRREYMRERLAEAFGEIST